MLITYIKKTGQVIASYPEYYGKAPTVKVKEEGKVVLTSKDLGSTYLMPREARRYMDPRKDKYDIHKCKVVLKNNEATHLVNPQTDSRVTVVSQKKLGEYLESWKNLYDGLKWLHPELTVEEALVSEGLV
jgi:hypothetical protein